MLEFFQRYSLDSFRRRHDAPPTGLKRDVSVWNLFATGFAATVGTGIFFTLGPAAQQAGVGLAICFLTGGIVAMLNVLPFCEFGAKIPVSGSAYSYITSVAGELIGWMIGWIMVVAYTVIVALEAQVWSKSLGHLIYYFDVSLPSWLDGLPIYGPVQLSVLSLLIVAFCSIILFLGIKELTFMNSVLTIINIAVVTMILIIGAINFDLNNWVNYMGRGQSFGSIQGMFSATGAVFFSFVGFDVVCALGSEVRNPEKSIPLSLVSIIATSTVFYVCAAVVLGGLTTAQSLNLSQPFQQAFLDLGLEWVDMLISACSLTILTSTIISTLVAQPRIVLSMATDGLLPSCFAYTSSHGVPIVATIASLIVTGGFAMIVDVRDMTNLISVSLLVVYTAVSIGTLIQRYQLEDQYPKKPRPLSHLGITEGIAGYIGASISTLLFCINSILIGVAARLDWSWIVLGILIVIAVVIYLYMQTLRQQTQPEYFACPLVPLLPLCSISFNIILICQLPTSSMILLAIICGVGLIVYLIFGIHNSHQKPVIPQSQPGTLDWNGRSMTAGQPELGNMSDVETVLGGSDPHENTSDGWESY